MKNVAIDVNHMFAHTNPISSDRPDVSSFGDDVPNHSHCSSTDDDHSISVDVSVTSSDDDNVPIAFLGKSCAAKSSQFNPTVVGPSTPFLAVEKFVAIFRQSLLMKFLFVSRKMSCV